MNDDAFQSKQGSSREPRQLSELCFRTQKRPWPGSGQGLDLVAGARNTFDLAVTIIGLPRIAA